MYKVTTKKLILVSQQDAVKIAAAKSAASAASAQEVQGDGRRQPRRQKQEQLEAEQLAVNFIAEQERQQFFAIQQKASSLLETYRDAVNDPTVLGPIWTNYLLTLSSSFLAPALDFDFDLETVRLNVLESVLQKNAAAKAVVVVPSSSAPKVVIVGATPTKTNVLQYRLKNPNTKVYTISEELETPFENLPTDVKSKYTGKTLASAQHFTFNPLDIAKWQELFGKIGNVDQVILDYTSEPVNAAFVYPDGVGWKEIVKHLNVGGKFWSYTREEAALPRTADVELRFGTITSAKDFPYPLLPVGLDTLAISEASPLRWLEVTKRS